MNPQPGDIVLCHTNDLIGKAIRLGERLRWKTGAGWNHIAILDKQLPNGDWAIIEAVGKGVIADGLLSQNPDHAIMALPTTVDRAKILWFLRAQVGVHYGFLTIASIVFNLLTPRFIAFRSNHTWICSGLAAGALWFAGWEHAASWTDLYQVTPAQLDEDMTGDGWELCRSPQ